MPPRTSRPKPKANARSNTVPSDYESDINSILPPVSVRTNMELNYSVLQRHLPSISSIILIAPYVVIYFFSTQSLTWEKNGIEGTLFVCGLSPLPGQSPKTERFAIIVLNRHGLNNFICELSNDGDVETSQEFIIMQEEDQIWGIWPFEGGELSSTSGMREELGDLLKTCSARLKEPKASPNRGDTANNNKINDSTKKNLKSKF